jgi:hypothetical protein
MTNMTEVMQAALDEINAALADNFNEDNQPYQYITLDRETVRQAQAALGCQTVPEVITKAHLLKIADEALQAIVNAAFNHDGDPDSLLSDEQTLRAIMGLPINSAAPAADREVE